MKNKNVDIKTMIIQRRILGILCALLAPCSLLFGLFGAFKGNYPTWYMTISDTYYANDKIIMIGLLASVSIFFFSYRGYDLHDRICSLIEAITALGIIVFPKNIPYIEYTGLFNLPIKLSGILHNACAGIMFLTFAYQILFLFTKGSNEPTGKKKLRNKIYITCGVIIVFFLVCMALADTVVFTSWVPAWFPIKWLDELFMLLPFSFAYLVKSEAINAFNDTISEKNI